MSPDARDGWDAPMYQLGEEGPPNAFQHGHPPNLGLIERHKRADHPLEGLTDFPKIPLLHPDAVPDELRRIRPDLPRRNLSVRTQAGLRSALACPYDGGYHGAALRRCLGHDRIHPGPELTNLVALAVEAPEQRERLLIVDPVRVLGHRREQ